MDNNFSEVLSLDGQTMVWSHDGKHGTESLSCPAGRFEKVLEFQIGTSYYAVGRRVADSAHAPANGRTKASYCAAHRTRWV